MIGRPRVSSASVGLLVTIVASICVLADTTGRVHYLAPNTPGFIDPVPCAQTGRLPFVMKAGDIIDESKLALPGGPQKQRFAVN